MRDVGCWTDTKIDYLDGPDQDTVHTLGNVKDNKDLNTRFWTLDTVFIPAFASMAFSLSRAPMTDNHFCVVFQPQIPAQA